MPWVHVYVSRGKFPSQESLREYVDPTYSEEEDRIPSSFMREIEISKYEPMCIEAIHSEATKPLMTLLQGVSYGEQWLALITAPVEANAAICVFEPNRIGRPQGSSLQYMGAFEYRV